MPRGGLGEFLFPPADERNEDIFVEVELVRPQRPGDFG